MLEISMPVNVFRERLAEAREKLRDLGQVNLMAPEEFEEVRERYEFLNGQLEDLKKGREDLRIVTEHIRAESTELFLDTYEKIKKNFHLIFRRLFGGGRAELTLTEPKNVLDSGISIHAQPPGKNLESIDLLSGGERSLTAVALLFATYMVKPSPFCVLDEIDAALDEENVGRFAHLLKEFSQSSQFIIITHNKRTVAAAETLLGVTMQESGVSTAISVRIGGRETAEVMQ
jgi:chromosome segregation protein